MVHSPHWPRLQVAVTVDLTTTTVASGTVFFHRVAIVLAKKKREENDRVKLVGVEAIF